MIKMPTFFAKHSSLMKNIGYISILRVVLLITPIVTYSYLIRVLGAENYGMILYVMSIVFFLRIFVKFGFDILGVKLVAENEENIIQLSSLFWSILLIQLSIFFIGSVVFIIIGKALKVSKEYELILFSCLLYPLADIFMLEWFYQGLQKMKTLVLSQFFSSTIGIILIFVIIDGNTNLALVPLIQGGAVFLGACYAFFQSFSLVDTKKISNKLEVKVFF